ncbi:MAG: thioredoxin family protein [Bdellovibrionales bacterium]|nr:thioredoxin family protein [Bdellovibrionales bacterium]
METLGSEGLLSIFYVFGAGFLSSLTPCVYPMIPITLSVFGATGDLPRKKAFLLSLCYVMGIVTTYTALGMFTAKTGMVFGSFLGNPFVVVAICLFMLLLALHSLEIFQIPLGSLQSKASVMGGRGFRGAFIMGLASGVVAAPCVGPVLAIVLLEAAKSQNVWWGAALLISYSLGLGMVFLILGTFSGLLNRLPRSGNWLNAVKYLIAIGVLTTACFFMTSIDHELFSQLLLYKRTFLVVLSLLAFASVPLAYKAYENSWASAKFVTSCVFAVLALFIFSKPPHSGEGADVEWFEQEQIALQRANEVERPVMIDLYADWCAACKKLDSQTFSDERVAQALKDKVVPTRVNFTTETTHTEELSEKYQVVGLPCILFVTKDGKEIPNSRVTGFMEPDAFLQHIDKVQQKI